jgi:hypothetical protein
VVFSSLRVRSESTAGPPSWRSSNLVFASSSRSPIRLPARMPVGHRRQRPYPTAASPSGAVPASRQANRPLAVTAPGGPASWIRESRKGKGRPASRPRMAGSVGRCPTCPFRKVRRGAYLSGAAKEPQLMNLRSGRPPRPATVELAMPGMQMESWRGARIRSALGLSPRAAEQCADRIRSALGAETQARCRDAGAPRGPAHRTAADRRARPTWRPARGRARRAARDRPWTGFSAKGGRGFPLVVLRYPNCLDSTPSASSFRPIRGR